MEDRKTQNWPNVKNAIRNTATQALIFGISRKVGSNRKSIMPKYSRTVNKMEFDPWLPNTHLSWTKVQDYDQCPQESQYVLFKTRISLPRPKLTLQTSAKLYIMHNNLLKNVSHFIIVDEVNVNQEMTRNKDFIRKYRTIHPDQEPFHEQLYNLFHKLMPEEAKEGYDPSQKYNQSLIKSSALRSEIKNMTMKL